MPGPYCPVISGNELLRKHFNTSEVHAAEPSVWTHISLPHSCAEGLIHTVLADMRDFIKMLIQYRMSINICKSVQHIDVTMTGNIPCLGIYLPNETSGNQHKRQRDAQPHDLDRGVELVSAQESQVAFHD